jgi:hypothetical protein
VSIVPPWQLPSSSRVQDVAVEVPGVNGQAEAVPAANAEVSTDLDERPKLQGG